jgi:hypothetical protein
MAASGANCARSSAARYEEDVSRRLPQRLQTRVMNVVRPTRETQKEIQAKWSHRKFAARQPRHAPQGSRASQ